MLLFWKHLLTKNLGRSFNYNLISNCCQFLMAFINGLYKYFLMALFFVSLYKAGIKFPKKLPFCNKSSILSPKKVITSETKN